MPETTTLREAVGLFHDASALRSAADELLLHGFDRADLSVLASEQAITSKLHRVYTAAELEDNPEAPTVAYFAGDSFTELRAMLIAAPFMIAALAAGAAVAANHGSLAASFIAAGVAGVVAGLIGGLLALWLSSRQRTYYDTQLREGGLLLWVRAADAEHEERACRILKDAAADDVHVHDVTRPERDLRMLRGKVVYGALEFLAGARRPPGTIIVR